MALGRAPKIVSEIQEYLQDLKRNHGETELLVTDDSVPLHKLCAKLEYMLQIDMKSAARSGMFAGKKDYWDYIYQCLYKVKGLNDGIRFVRAKTEVKTSLGRGRAFIRYSLAHHRLGDSLQQCFNNQKVTSLWYNPNSLLLNPSLYGPLINDLYDLNDLHFDLAPSGHDLDAAWPSYSRRAVGGPGMYNLWQPPSRTESLSSLSSQPSTLDGYSSPTAESRPSIGDEKALQAQTELDECEQVNRELRRRIIKLEKDNDEVHRLAMETEERMSGMQSELERKIQELQYQLERAKKDSVTARENFNQMGQDWQKKLEDAEKVNIDLCDRLEAINIQHASQEKMWQEAKHAHELELIEARHSLAEVRVELSATKSALEASRATEQRKGELVKSTEEKISLLEVKNAELLKRMEGMVESKDAEVANHLQSANKVHELLDKLSDAETRNLKLIGERDSLGRQVELLEENCSSQEKVVVVRVAELEQSLKQREAENAALGERLANEAREHERVVRELKKSVNTFEEEKDNLEFSLTEHVKLLEVSRKNAELKQSEGFQSKKELESLQVRMAELIRDVERYRKELHAAGVQEKELKGRVRHLEEVCRDKEGAIGELETRLDDSLRQAEAQALIELERERIELSEQQLQESLAQIKKLETEKHALSTQFKVIESVFRNKEQNGGQTSESLQQNSCEVGGGNAPLGRLVQEQFQKVISERDELCNKLNEVQADNKALLIEIKILSEKSSTDSQSFMAMREQVEKLQGENETLRQRLASMSKTLDSKERCLQDRNLELQRLEEQQQVTVSEKEKLELDVIRIRFAIDSKDKERDELIGERTLCEERMDEMRRGQETMQQERDIAQGRLQEKGQVISQLMSDIERLKKEKQEAEDARERTQKLLDRERQTSRDLEDTVEDLKRLQVESVSLEQVYDERKTKMMQEHADKVEFLTEQFQMMKEEQEKTSSERLHYQDLSESLAKELERVKDQCEILESENVAVRDKNNDLNQEYLRMLEDVELSRTERNEITEKLEQVSTETSQSLQDTKLEIERLQGRVRSSEEEERERSSRVRVLEEELNTERRRAAELEARAKDAEEEAVRVRGTTNEEVSALKFQLSSEAMQYQQTLQGYQKQERELELMRKKIEEQDESNAELRTELTKVKRKGNQEKADVQRKLSEQESELARQEQQIVILQDSAEELSRYLEEEKRVSANLKAEVTELRNENGNRMSSLEAELALAVDDNEQLKRQLVKLIKEKNTLWQRTEKLEYHRKMKAHERWLEDKQVTQCMQCACDFSLTVRRHHCRLCGKIFCAKCAGFYVLTSHSKGKSRVCEQCFVIHRHSLESPSVNTSIISHNSSQEDLEEGAAMRVSPKSTGVDEGMSDVTSEGVGSEPGAVEDLNDATQHEGSDVAAADERQEDADALPAIPAANQMSSEPEFDIISEDEVSQARWEDPESTEEGSKRFLSTEELEGVGMSGEEVIVTADHKHTLSVAINDVGLMLCWEFVSSPKSIGFLVTYHESRDLTATPEELIPLCRCNSHQQAVQGELLARKPGVYSLVFDNKFSRFTSKTVKYSLHIKRPEAAY